MMKLSDGAAAAPPLHVDLAIDNSAVPDDLHAQAIAVCKALIPAWNSLDDAEITVRWCWACFSELYL